jgi:hypothetical protein
MNPILFMGEKRQHESIAPFSLDRLCFVISPTHLLFVGGPKPAAGSSHTHNTAVIGDR